MDFYCDKIIKQNDINVLLLNIRIIKIFTTIYSISGKVICEQPLLFVSTLVHFRIIKDGLNLRSMFEHA